MWFLRVVSDGPRSRFPSKFRNSETVFEGSFGILLGGLSGLELDFTTGAGAMTFLDPEVAPAVLGLVCGELAAPAQHEVNSLFNLGWPAIR